ncbi:DUF4221 family protein [Daejeonella lutea]|uniref:DUF4221 domain-containing protein n=1 Tax=Daejeonella lutea TaxID=572036 RepID=A0A1T5B1T6_9SPHI|nr:DUF4221 family protein [Daejeonella lutea]SKB41192.1 protein of unknown function [Daejeonella lutea]
MKNISLASTLYLLIFLISCKEKVAVKSSDPYYNKKNSLEYKDSVTLQANGSVSFPLSANVPLLSKSIHFFTDESGRYYTSLSLFDEQLNIYNYDSRKLVKSVKLAHEGINGVGKAEYLNHYMKSIDTIYINNEWFCRFYIVNDSAKVIGKVEFPEPGSGKFLTGPTAKPSREMKRVGNTLYVTGNLTDLNIPDHTSVKNVLTVDMTNFQPGRVFPRTELFNKGSWGASSYELFNTYNDNTKMFIYGYGGDPFLYETDHSGSPKKHYIGSKYFEKVIPFSEEKVANDKVDLKMFEKHDMVTPQYGKILFDKYRNMYYRFAYLPLTDEEYQDPNKRFRKESVIIADSNFRKIGEIVLPYKTYNTNMFFIANEGLHLAKIPELQGNGDSIKYDILKIAKK